MQIDLDGLQSITAEAINKFLEDLGLEPEEQAGALIMQELDPKALGNVTRDDFLQFVRDGGRIRNRASHSLDSAFSMDLDADRANLDPKSKPDAASNC